MAGDTDARHLGTSWFSVAADAARTAACRTRGSSHARPVTRMTHRVRDPSHAWHVARVACHVRSVARAARQPATATALAATLASAANDAPAFTATASPP